MKRRRLGDSDLEVSEISLGSWLTYSGGSSGRDRGVHPRRVRRRDQLLRHRQRLRRGAAEEAWGEILSDYRARTTCSRPRSTSRCRTPTAGCPPRRSRSRSTPRCARLRTDHVDLYQCHRFDSQTPIEDTMEALPRWSSSGKARYLGLQRVDAGPDPRRPRASPGRVTLVSSQPQYNVIWRAPEAEVFGVSAEHGISHIVWSPIAEGVLTGKYRPGEPAPGDSRAASDEMSLRSSATWTRRCSRPCSASCRSPRGPGSRCRRWRWPGSCAAPELASAIIGASRPEQVHANAAAAGIELSRRHPGRDRRGARRRRGHRPRLAGFAREGVKHR